MKRDPMAGFKSGVWLTWGVAAVARSHQLAGREAFWDSYLDGPVAVFIFSAVSLILGGCWALQAMRQERKLKP